MSVKERRIFIYLVNTYYTIFTCTLNIRMYLNSGHKYTNQCCFVNEYESCNICRQNKNHQCWINREISNLSYHHKSIDLLCRLKCIVDVVIKHFRFGMVITLTKNLKDLTDYFCLIHNLQISEEYSYTFIQLSYGKKRTNA